MPKPPTVAIVGAGPSGCFVAQFLERKWPNAEISIFEAMPVPYGLVRYGVAADHQGSKSVTQQFERMFQKGNVKFFGNVSVGRDITFQKLAESFDVLVLATGLKQDAPLEVPTHPQACVIGAGQILKALNGYPLHSLPKENDGQLRPLGRDIAVIGSGNVAIDFLRMICKSSSEFSGSDVADEILMRLKASGLKSIKMFSRSSVAQVKCDKSMLEEFLRLPGVDVKIANVFEEEGAIPDLLRGYKANCAINENPLVEVELIFDVVMEEMDCIDGRAIINSKNKVTAGSRIDAFDTVVTAIGFANPSGQDKLIPGEDCLGGSIYRVGWLKRGPKGTVAENRKDAKSVADHICQDFDSGINRSEKPGLVSIIHELSQNVVDYEGWCRIDRYERESAALGRCRNKLRDMLMMVRVARGEV